MKNNKGDGKLKITLTDKDKKQKNTEIRNASSKSPMNFKPNQHKVIIKAPLTPVNMNVMNIYEHHSPLPSHSPSYSPSPLPSPIIFKTKSPIRSPIMFQNFYKKLGKNIAINENNLDQIYAKENYNHHYDNKDINLIKKNIEELNKQKEIQKQKSKKVYNTKDYNFN